MNKRYYKDPKTGEIKPGDFEDAWRSFVDDSKDQEYYDAEEAQLDDEEEFPVPYDDEGRPLGENEENDPQEIKVGSYQTKYFDVCPGASTLYSNIEEKVEDIEMAERAAKLQDALFFLEKHILEDKETGDPEGYITTAENLADQIMAMAKMMGLEKEHNYIQGHVDIIKKALK